MPVTSRVFSSANLTFAFAVFLTIPVWVRYMPISPADGSAFASLIHLSAEGHIGE